MKIGIRTPSIKKSFKARTTGKLKRSMKKAVNPVYGKKGMGLINDPKKAVYNKVYNKTTTSVFDLDKGSKKKTPKTTTATSSTVQKDIQSSRTQEYEYIKSPPTTEKKIIFGTIAGALWVYYLFSMFITDKYADWPLIEKIGIFIAITCLLSFGYIYFINRPKKVPKK